MGKKEVGRPREYASPEIERIKEKMIKYIDDSEIPIVAEFAYINNIPRTVFYDYPEFSTLRKRLLDKKEAQLEKGTLAGAITASMAIFSLKQLGWKDKQEMEHSIDNDAYKKLKELYGG